MIPLILGVAASFFGGAYVGTVVENATAAPQVAVQQATISDNKSLTTKDFLIAGAIGAGTWFLYRKFLK